jgi:hypothetical protein
MQFLQRIAERQSSFIFFAGKLYALQEGTSNDYMKAVDATVAMVPSLSFTDLERLDDRVNAQNYEAYCKEYIKNEMHKELKAQESISKEKERLQTLKFIMTEFIPYLLSKKYESAELIYKDILGITGEDPVQRAKLEIAEKLRADFGTEKLAADPSEDLRLKILQNEKKQFKITPLIQATYRIPGKQSILGALTDHQPLYVQDGELFLLEPGKGELSFVIDGTEYVPKRQAVSLGQLDAEFEKMKQQMWRIDALERSQDTFAEIRDQIKKSQVSENTCLNFQNSKSMI